MTRLIDADAIEYSPLDDIYNNDVMVAYKESIENMPTVDAEPVRHGKWIKYYETDEGRSLRCSKCLMVFWVGNGRSGNYCPNCGAKMDAERKEE